MYYSFCWLICLGVVGIAGKGVNVVILDDGLDYKSRDLADNFVRIFL